MTKGDSPNAASDAVAVIGGGVAGLAAARGLARGGVAVSVFDKGRGVAGRVSTRRAEPERRFDHGAQYFTAADDRFAAEVSEWLAEGAAAEWRGRIRSFTWGDEGPVEDGPPGRKTRYVGTPGMNSIALRLAEQARDAGASIASSTRVAALERTSGGWRLAAEDGRRLGEFARVLVTAPGPEAADLLTASPALAGAARSVRMTGCWAAMLAFEDPPAAGFDGAFINGTPESTPLSWVARNSSKPGRPPVEAAGDCWVLHASPAWSEARLDADVAAVVSELTTAFAALVGEDATSPAFARAHLWRYALPERPLGERVLIDQARGLYAAGDWCGGPRVEGAFLSGLAAADAMR